MSTTLSDIRESFWHAAMAKAAYAAITDDGTLRQALNDDGFSPALIDEFLDRYSVQAVASSADSYQGVIFREKNTSHYILASRGTQEITDFGVDGILALFGSTPQDGNARGLFGQIISIPDVSEITVTGHSLGGYLATMLAHEYGSQIDHLYTYNGAGYGTPILPVQASLFLTNSALSNLFGANPISFPLDSASNFITDENVEVVPTLGFHLGEITKINTDVSNLGSVVGHGIAPLADALLVNYLFKALDGSLEFEKTNGFLEKMYADETLDRNAAVTYLGLIFPDLLSVNPADSMASSDDAIGEAILQGAIFDLLAGFDLGSAGLGIEADVVDLSSLSVSSLIAQTEQGTADGAAIRHALLNGSSFAIQSIQGQGQAASDAFQGNPDLAVENFSGSIPPELTSRYEDDGFWKLYSDYYRALIGKNDGLVSPFIARISGNTHYVIECY